MTQVSVDASAPRPRVVSAAQLGSGEFIDAAFIRSARGAPALRLSQPEGYLLVYRSKPGYQASWIVARMDLSGQLQWKADTGALTSHALVQR